MQLDSSLIESRNSHFRSVKLGMKEQAMICYGKRNVKSVVLVRLCFPRSFIFMLAPEIVKQHFQFDARNCQKVGTFSGSSSG